MDEAYGKSQKCIVTIDLDASVGELLDMSYPLSHEGKSQVLSSNKICKRRKLIQMWTQNWQAHKYINERQSTARGKTLREDEQILLYIRLTMKNLIGREHSINSQ